MTEEEKKAIELFNSYINAIDTFGTIDYKCINNLYEPAKTILNLVKKQQEEIEKKDKIIDLMARRILIYQLKDSKLAEKICSQCGYEDCCDEISQDCIKQYFENKVEGSK